MHWLLTLFLIASCGATATVDSDLRREVTTARGIQPGDRFNVRVYGEEELSAEYLLDEDGTFDFPFLGAVAGEGLSSRELADRIAQGLREREIMLDPQVTVLLGESSVRVSVIGAVARPGTFPVDAGMTLVQAISEAGGFAPLASRNQTVLTRRFSDGTRRFTIPAGDISEGRVEDVPLQAGDIVFVPERVF